MSKADAHLAVLGVTSAAGAVGQASAAQYSGRRNNVRRVHNLFATSAAAIILRFLVATPRTASDHFAAISDEQHRHKDLKLKLTLTYIRTEIEMLDSTHFSN